MNLSRKVLENAVSNALDNAKELFEEAEILENKQKFPRAYTLFHLAIEEVGKVFIIFKYLLGNDYSEDKMKKFDAEFRQHKTKIDLATNIDVIAAWLIKGGELTKEIIEKATYTKKQIDNLNDLKNLSLYSFFHKDLSYKPSDMIQKEDVEEIHLIAEYRIKGTEDLVKVLLNDLDRFIEIVKNKTP